jgi:hypothetical protein
VASLTYAFQIVTTWTPVLVTGLLCACAGGLQEIPRGEHPITGATPVAVDTPPPPARAETVPAKPKPDCLWVEGHWSRKGSNWAWSPGRWVRLTEPCYYAESLAIWIPTSDGHGALFYTPGEWYKRVDNSLCASLELCSASNQPAQPP